MMMMSQISTSNALPRIAIGSLECDEGEGSGAIERRPRHGGATS